MNNRTITLAAAATLAVAALGLTACSSDEPSSTAAATTTAAGAGFEDGKKVEGTQEGDAPMTTPVPDLPAPTVEELNARLDKAMAGQLSAEEKATLIEDAERDPNLVDKFVEAAKKNNVTAKITSVGAPADGKVKAPADVTIDGTPVQGATVEFVASEGGWRVSHVFTCNIVKSAKLDSAACQA
ncbi:hypothetical protein [Nocardia asteroides]|uniref:hypothetical protein n=1 Tax=Nocardia asteroides TaxID=1824 RepID=UPI001E5E0ADC|nr:hypothetical protein [Nocardia asteroides]UGT56746.1 hypothetical protein LTT85_07775 [Nocardia asteroides]